MNPPPFGGRRVLIAAIAVAAVGVVLTALGLVLGPRRTLFAYLAAYTCVASVALGALVLLLIGYATNARWMAAVRRVHEVLVLAFPALAILFLPIAFGLDELYLWVDPPADLPVHELHLLHEKEVYLNVPFFLVRTAAYFVVWLLAAELLRRWSRRRDGLAPATDPDAALGRERVFASVMLPIVGFAVTFAAFDWLMSLQPTWFSSIFGVYYFAGGFVSAIGLLIALAASARRRDLVDGAITPNHFHALGRLLFAFTVFWAYTAYFQAFLIRIANRPEEVTFYLARMAGGWEPFVWIQIIGQFALPFLLLAPRRVKFIPGYLTAVAALILVVHFLEVYWLVLPAAYPFTPSWVDLAALAAVGGIAVAVCAWRQRGVPLVADGDPFLPAGRHYASPL